VPVGLLAAEIRRRPIRRRYRATGWPRRSGAREQGPRRSVSTSGEIAPTGRTGYAHGPMISTRSGRQRPEREISEALDDNRKVPAVVTRLRPLNSGRLVVGQEMLAYVAPERGTRRCRQLVWLATSACRVVTRAFGSGQSSACRRSICTLRTPSPDLLRPGRPAASGWL